MSQEGTQRRSMVNSVKIIQVIEVKSVMGEGVDYDPMREVVQFFNMEGKILATYDPCCVANVIEGGPK